MVRGSMLLVPSGQSTRIETEHERPLPTVPPPLARRRCCRPAASSVLVVVVVGVAVVVVAAALSRYKLLDGVVVVLLLHLVPSLLVPRTVQRYTPYRRTVSIFKFSTA